MRIAGSVHSTAPRRPPRPRSTECQKQRRHGVHSTAPRRPPRPIQTDPLPAIQTVSIQQRRVGLRGVRAIYNPNGRKLCPFNSAASASAAEGIRVGKPSSSLCPFNKRRVGLRGEAIIADMNLIQGVHSTAPRRPPRLSQRAAWKTMSLSCPFNSAASASAARGEQTAGRVGRKCPFNMAASASAAQPRPVLPVGPIPCPFNSAASASAANQKLPCRHRVRVSIQQRRVGLRGLAREFRLAKCLGVHSTAPRRPPRPLEVVDCWTLLTCVHSTAPRRPSVMGTTDSAFAVKSPLTLTIWETASFGRFWGPCCMRRSMLGNKRTDHREKVTTTTLNSETRPKSLG